MAVVSLSLDQVRKLCFLKQVHIWQPFYTLTCNNWTYYHRLTRPTRWAANHILALCCRVVAQSLISRGDDARDHTNKWRRSDTDGSLVARPPSLHVPLRTTWTHLDSLEPIRIRWNPLGLTETHSVSLEPTRTHYDECYLQISQHCFNSLAPLRTGELSLLLLYSDLAPIHFTLAITGPPSCLILTCGTKTL